jgi:hypothetical protein
MMRLALGRAGQPALIGCSSRHRGGHNPQRSRSRRHGEEQLPARRRRTLRVPVLGEPVVCIGVSTATEY